jgi:hypothetical protein
MKRPPKPSHCQRLICREPATTWVHGTGYGYWYCDRHGAEWREDQRKWRKKRRDEFLANVLMVPVYIVAGLVMLNFLRAIVHAVLH